MPDEWDKLTTDYFQTKAFLAHTEQYNPCNQRYYWLETDNGLKAGAVVYSINLDLLTFLRLKSPIKMHIVGIPCSVSCPGIMGSSLGKAELLRIIKDHERGFLLFLNLIEKPLSELASGDTLPTVVLHNKFSTYSEYLNALRSDYRRRIKKLERISESVRLEKQFFSDFSPAMYQQYLNVYNRSKDKLEKLDQDFFQNLADPFRLTVCYCNNAPIGWNITLLHDETFYFFLGGIDYRYQEKYATYLRLMLQIIKDGIAEGVKWIDLGQTAEIPKMRLGGQLERRYMVAHHSNKLFNRLLKLAEKALVYNRKVPQVNVFKI